MKRNRGGGKQGNSRDNETKVFHGLDSAHYSVGQRSVKVETARIANPFVASNHPYFVFRHRLKRKIKKKKKRIKSVSTDSRAKESSL